MPNELPECVGTDLGAAPLNGWARSPGPACPAPPCGDASAVGLPMHVGVTGSLVTGSKTSRYRGPAEGLPSAHASIAFVCQKVDLKTQNVH